MNALRMIARCAKGQTPEVPGPQAGELRDVYSMDHSAPPSDTVLTEERMGNGATLAPAWAGVDAG